MPKFKVALTLRKKIEFELDPATDEAFREVLEEMASNEGDVTVDDLLSDNACVHDAIQEMMSADFDAFLENFIVPELCEHDWHIETKED